MLAETSLQGSKHRSARQKQLRHAGGADSEPNQGEKAGQPMLMHTHYGSRGSNTKGI